MYVFLFSYLLVIVSNCEVHTRMVWLCLCCSSGWLSSLYNKKAQLTLTNPRDAEACKNCSNSTCFVSFHRIPFRQISNYRCIASRD